LVFEFVVGVFNVGSLPVEVDKGAEVFGQVSD